MNKKILNKNGASLVEILAIIVLSSIVLVTVSNILSFNVRQNAINQEKTIHANIASGVLNYMQSVPYSDIKTLNQNNSYTLFTQDSCQTDDLICKQAVAPLINSKDYADRIKIFIIPYQSSTIRDLQFTAPEQIVEVPRAWDHIQAIDTSTNVESTRMYRVIIVVESQINSQFDYLIEGVITNEN